MTKNYLANFFNLYKEDMGDSDLEKKEKTKL